MEVERNVVIGVDAGGDDDVHFSSLGDALDARNVAAQADHGEIDDRMNAVRSKFVQAGDGVINAALFSRPRPRDNSA